MIIQQQSLRHPEILAKRNAFFMKVRLKTVLTAKTLSQNGLTIVATPQSFIYGDKIKIILSLDTHSGDLSFDLTKVTTLIDSSGTSYIPTCGLARYPEGTIHREP